MRMKLYRSSSHRPFDIPENAGLDQVDGLLVAVRVRGVGADVVDTAAVPEAQREAAYFEAATVAVRRHVPLRRVFGSNRAGGTAFFGREVPALVVYDDHGGSPIDVLPREKDGVLVTIRDYLTGLSLSASVG